MMLLFVIMSTTDDTIYQGRVKWFNNKTGYGFVTVIDGDKVGTDVFAHHSGISVDDEQYKYLVQGEYIQFNLSNVESSENYKYQAANITGIKKGKLLCETRNENRTTMSSRTGDNSNNNKSNSDINLVAKVKKLPKVQRDIVILRIFQDMSFKQVSEILTITENSAKVSFYKAKINLKGYINAV